MIFELLHTNEPDHPCSHLLYSFKIEEQKKNGYAKIKIIKSQMIREGKYTSSDEDYVMEELARYSQKNKKLYIKNYSAKNNIILSYYSKPCTTTCMPFKLNPGDRLDFEAKDEISDLKVMLFSKDEVASDELDGFADFIKDMQNAQAIEVTPFSIKPNGKLEFETRDEVSDLRELVKHQPPASSSEEHPPDQDSVHDHCRKEDEAHPEPSSAAEQATHSGQEQQDCMKTSADQGHSKAPEPTRLICI